MDDSTNTPGPLQTASVAVNFLWSIATVLIMAFLFGAIAGWWGPCAKSEGDDVAPAAPAKVGYSPWSGYARATTMPTFMASCLMNCRMEAGCAVADARELFACYNGDRCPSDIQEVALEKRCPLPWQCRDRCTHDAWVKFKGQPPAN